nr:hypothetical protein [Tanacetum cinerariifolium]
MFNRFRDRRKLKIRDWDIGKNIPLDDDAGKERYWDRGDSYGRKREYRVGDEGRERHRVSCRGKLIRDDDARKKRYLDRGDSSHDLKPDGANDDAILWKDIGIEVIGMARKREYRVGDEGRERHRVSCRGKLIRDDDARKERYLDRGDSFHDLKPDGANDDTQNRKRKQADRGHDERRKKYRDRGY